jgi:CHAT domain-containing protein/tetratricopeptide (TPR) repeat protein
MLIKFTLNKPFSRLNLIAILLNRLTIFICSLLIVYFISAELTSSCQSGSKQKHLNADSLYNEALKLRKSGEYFKAANLFDEAATLAEKQSQIILQVRSLMLEANTYLDLQQKSDASSVVKRLDQLMDKKKNLSPELISNLHFLKGQVLFRYSLKKSALKEYLLSSQIKETNKMIDSFLVKAYNNISILYGDTGKYQESLDYSLKLVNLAKKLYGPKNYRLAKYYMNLGASYFDLDNMDEAMFYLNESEQIYVSSFGRQFYSLAVVYEDKAKIYRKQGDYEKSFNLYQSALRLANENPKMYFNPKGNILGSIGVFYSVKGENSFKMGEHIQAREYYKKALEYTYQAIAIKEKEEPNRFVYLYSNLGDYYRAIGNYKKSLENFNLSVEREIKYNGESTDLLGLCYEEMGTLYGDSLKDYSNAFKYYNKAVNHYVNLFGLHDIRTAGSLSLLAKHYFSLGKYELALSYSHESVKGITVRYDDSIFYNNPLANDVKPFKTSLEIISMKARIFREIYYRDHDLKKLITAFETYQLASDIIDKLRPSYSSEQSKLDLAANENETYEQLVAIAYKIYQITHDNFYFYEAFKYSEHSKASSLLSSMKSNEARQYSGIPAEMLKYELKLRKEISFIQEELYEKPKEASAIKDQVSILQLKLLNLNLSYDSLIQNFEINYPEYYKLKYQSTSVSVKDVQAFLGKKNVLIEYFLSDTLLYSFVISKEKAEIITRKIDKKFSEDLGSFQKSLAFPNFARHTIETYRQFITTGHSLFEQLLGEIYENNKDKELLIIPDGKMAYLPFDILLTDTGNHYQVNYAALPYLIKKTMVSYNYSATLMLSRKGKYQPFPKMLAFAPDYKTDNPALARYRSGTDYRSRLFPLPGAIEEVESISRFFSSNIFMGERATESNFKQLASGYSIIHLAMHTIIDNKNPMYSKLAFSHSRDSSNDGLLNTYEIYNLQLKARLAVLSSCNSGNGQFSRGEGVMSLARAFIYAGCPSIVMSLWEIEDRSGAAIIKNFYEQLNRGKRTDESLRLAKLKFLETADPLTSHPYFWAGYVTIGDTSGIKRYRLIWIIGITSIVLLSAFLIRRKMVSVRRSRDQNGSLR